MNKYILQMEEGKKWMYLFKAVELDMRISEISDLKCDAEGERAQHLREHRCEQNANSEKWIDLEKFPLVLKWKKRYKYFSWFFYMATWLYS